MSYIFTDHHKLDPVTLMQGDLLKITDSLNQLLKSNRSQYNDFDNINYLVVLTQSCDLIRRNGKAKSRHITLAPVHSLDIAIKDRTHKLKDKNIDSQLSICNSNDHSQTLQYVERLLSNSEKDYFCLPLECHKDFIVDYCISLNVSIAIRNTFYEQCLEAKIGQMEEIYAAKLGWMTGNQFSRVATPDVEDIFTTTQEGGQFRSTFLNRVFTSQTIWLSTHQIRELKKLIKRSNVSNPVSSNTLRDLTSQIPSNYSLAINRVVQVLLTNKIIDTEQVDTIREKLNEDRNLKNLVVNTID